ncbi:hypothetical protein [Nocardioides sp. SYSU D00065]|nr:hypothetical protein [Nocardioides sp. SYSU D00065]
MSGLGTRAGELLGPRHTVYVVALVCASTRSIDGAAGRLLAEAGDAS